MKLDNLLRKHGIITDKQQKTPEQVKDELARHISSTPAMTFTDAADFEDLDIKLVHDFKRKLSSMSREERNYVITMLMFQHTFENLETGLPEQLNES